MTLPQVKHLTGIIIVYGWRDKSCLLLRTRLAPPYLCTMGLVLSPPALLLAVLLPSPVPLLASILPLLSLPSPPLSPTSFLTSTLLRALCFSC